MDTEIKQNSSYRVPIMLINSSTGLGLTGVTAPTVYLQKYYGTSTSKSITNNSNWFEINSTYFPGMYDLLLSSSDTDTVGELKVSAKFSTSTFSINTFTIVDYTQDEIFNTLNYIRKCKRNRTKISTDGYMTLYDDDNVTPLIVYNLYNNNGVLDSKVVYQRVPQTVYSTPAQAINVGRERFVPRDNYTIIQFRLWETGTLFANYGNNNYLTPMAQLTERTTTVLNAAGLFNDCQNLGGCPLSSSEIVGTNNSSNVNPNPQLFSMSIWCKADRFTADENLIFMKQKNINSWSSTFVSVGFYPYRAEGLLRIVLTTIGSPGASFVNTGVKLTVNEWMLLSITFNSGTMRVYINGALVKTATQSNSSDDGVSGTFYNLSAGIEFSTGPWAIGGMGSSIQYGTSNFYGLVEDARVDSGIERSQLYYEDMYKRGMNFFEIMVG